MLQTMKPSFGLTWAKVNKAGRGKISNGRELQLISETTASLVMVSLSTISIRAALATAGS